MFSQRFLVASFSMFALAFASVAADAQVGTGPITKKDGVKSMQAAPGAAQELTPDRVVSLLQAKGAEATAQKSVELKGGIKVTVVKVKMQKDDFGYDFNVLLMTYSNGVKQWYLSADLNTKALDLPLHKMQGLMKRNSLMNGSHFFSIDNAGFLMLQSGNFLIGQTDQTFLNETNVYMKNIKDSYDSWRPGE